MNGKQFRAWREREGISQAEAGKRAGVSPRTVIRAEQRPEADVPLGLLNLAAPPASKAPEPTSDVAAERAPEAPPSPDRAVNVGAIKLQLGKDGAKIRDSGTPANVVKREPNDPLSAAERNALHRAMDKALFEDGPTPKYVMRPSEKARADALNVGERYSAWEKARRAAGQPTE